LCWFLCYPPKLSKSLVVQPLVPLIVGIVALVIMISRSSGASGVSGAAQQPARQPDAMETLRQRFAHGEISREEFEQAREALRQP